MAGEDDKFNNIQTKIMNKLRSDSAFCQLTPEQVDVLEGWLFEERLGYPTVLEKLKAEFGLETSLTGLRRFYKRLEMERSRVSLMDAVEMGGLAVEALRSGTLKPGMLVLANKCAIRVDDAVASANKGSDGVAAGDNVG